MLAPAIRQPLLLLLIAAGVLFFKLGSAELWDRDEPRNARCAQEMLERGDWVTPTFNGQLRTHKPVLLYWLIMGSYQLFGVNEFAARFASAAVSVGTVLATYLIGKRLFSPQAGFWAGIALATSPLFATSARAATPDATLIFCMTAGMLAFVYQVFPAERETSRLVRSVRSRLLHCVLYGCLGLAMLAKGPVGLVLPLLTIGLFYVVSQSPTGSALDSWQETFLRWLKAFAPRHILSATRLMGLASGIPIALLIAAPWYLAVGYATNGEFLTEFFGDHNLGRALASKEGHHGFGPPFYLAVIIAGVFPWSVLAVPLVIDTYRNGRTESAARNGIQLAACWIFAYLLVFSVARTKLPSYVTPCYPAVALLVGLFIDRWSAGKLLINPRWFAAAMSALLLAGVGAAVGIALAAQKFVPEETRLATGGLVIAVCGALGIFGWWWERPRAMIGALAAAAILVALGLHGVIASRVSAQQQAAAMLRELSLADAPETRWLSVSGVEPSWVFYANRTIIDEPWFAHHPERMTAEFLAELANSDEPTVVLLTTTDPAALEASLGSDVQVLGHAPLLFRKRQLMLISSQAVATRIAANLKATDTTPLAKSLRIGVGDYR